MNDNPKKLSDFPYVMVRIRCDECKRFGQSRLTRAAAAFGPEISLDDLLARMVGDCPYLLDRRPRKYQAFCLAYFCDLRHPPGPPDLPPAMRVLKVVKG